MTNTTNFKVLSASVAPDIKNMFRKDKHVHINFDWAGHPPHRHIPPESDPLMRPLFGGVFQRKLFAPSAMLASLFVFLVFWTNFFVGSDPETDAYFYAVEQRAESVCLGETEYLGDMYASVPVTWKSVTGEEVSAVIEMVKESKGVSFGEHWVTEGVVFDSANSCPESNWRQTAWNNGVSSPTPGASVGGTVPDSFYEEAQEEYNRTRQDIVSLTGNS